MIPLTGQLKPHFCFLIRLWFSVSQTRPIRTSYWPALGSHSRSVAAQCIPWPPLCLPIFQPCSSLFQSLPLLVSDLLPVPVPAPAPALCSPCSPPVSDFWFQSLAQPLAYDFRLPSSSDIWLLSLWYWTLAYFLISAHPGPSSKQSAKLSLPPLGPIAYGSVSCTCPHAQVVIDHDIWGWEGIFP